MVPEILYRRSIGLIASVALALMLLGAELGYLLGWNGHPGYDALTRGQFLGIQAASLGLLALLLGFTFTMAMSRFEYRKQMVVQESNAIGTAVLRAQFLPAASADEVDALFRRYVEIRLASVLGTSQGTPERDALDREDGEIQRQLWRLGKEAAVADPRSVPAGLYVQALNDVIDSKARRDIAVANHVPESVLLFLLAFAVLSAAIVGYGNGLAGSRIIGLTAAYCTVVVVVIGVIMDLDRPQSGLARISQQSMLQLCETLETRVP